MNKKENWCTVFVKYFKLHQNQPAHDTVKVTNYKSYKVTMHRIKRISVKHYKKH